MEFVDSASVSKGCYVVKGESRKSFKTEDYLRSKGIQTNTRNQIAECCWKNVCFAFKNLQSKLQENIFMDILSYIKPGDHNETEPLSEIPTAVVNSGVNMPDHAATFQELKHKIIDAVSPYVVVLHASDCNNMKLMMRSVADQLLASFDTHFGFNNHDLCDSDEISFMRKKSSTVTMSLIKKCYWQVIKFQGQQCSPRKKQRLSLNSVSEPPIVVIFQNLEAFNSKLLQDFVQMTSFYISSLPISFIMGVATSWSNLSDRLFPHSVLVNMSVKIFSAPPASAHLALLLDEVLLTWNYPFKLSGRCLQLLLDVFLCHDFSITNFLHILKFCILEHFYEKSCSILCTCDHGEAEVVLSKFGKNEMNEFRDVPSVRRYLSSLNNEEQKLMKKVSVFKDKISTFLRDLHSYHRIYFSVLRSLNALTSSLPNHPMGKQLREVYIACSRNDLIGCEGFIEAFTFLKVSSRDQLITRLSACLSCLKANNQSKSGEHEILSDAIKKIEGAVKELIDIGQSESSNQDNDDSDDDDVIETVKYAYQLQERLRNRCKSKRQKKMTKFEKVRLDILTYLKSFYEFHLRQVQNLPLHEIYYFDSANLIKRHLIAAPRLSIQTALSDPYQYLKVSSLESVVDGIIPNNAPDICVAYKLHNECGALINLFDWMQAFRTIVTSSNEQDAEQDEIDVEIDDITQARFIRSVSELQFLGFIRPTRKKTDHVQRLTWSHV